MRRPPSRPQTPLTHAIQATGFMILFGLAYRLVGGAFDPEMRTWALVAAAPFVGLLVYLQQTHRASIVGLVLIIVGIGGLVFWTVILAKGVLPLNNRMDYFYLVVILAFPLGCVWYGTRQWLKARATTNAQEP